MIGDKTLCANAQKCTNTDCIRHPQPLTDAERKDLNYWRRIRWLDYHLPSNGITCKYRKEEPK